MNLLYLISVLRFCLHLAYVKAAQLSHFRLNQKTSLPTTNNGENKIVLNTQFVQVFTYKGALKQHDVHSNSESEGNVGIDMVMHVCTRFQ